MRWTRSISRNTKIAQIIAAVGMAIGIALATGAESAFAGLKWG